MSEFKEQKESKRPLRYFSSEGDGMLGKIIICAVLFHMLIAGICMGLHYVNFKPEPEPIPVFEMVQVQQPRVRHHVQRPKPVQPKPEPPKEQPKQKVEPKPVKQKINKQLPPEPKIDEKKPEPEPEPEPEQKPVEEPTPDPEPDPEPAPDPTDDFDVDDMDLPTSVEAPSLNPVGSVDMDPLMQVYLDQLKKIIMKNFNPPSNLNVKKNVKTTVQFTVDRFGGISGVILKRSSGNSTWDHLSVRAVTISNSHLPELPPNFRAPSIVLHFNFTPN